MKTKEKEMNKFNKFDYLELEIKETNKLDKKEPKKSYELSGNLGYDLVNELVEEALEKGKIVYKKDEEFIEFHKENQKLSIKVIKHKKPSSHVLKLIEKNLEFAQTISESTETLDKLVEEINRLKKENIQNQEEFKKQILEMQKKAQNIVNENNQKRDEHYANELSKAKQYALQKFLEELLIPLNNFELAINAANKIDNDIVRNYARGFDMLAKQIDNVLEDAGLRKIIPKIGDVFDANEQQIHNLIENEEFKNKIIEIKNIGYKLHDRVIKPALVDVGK
ncbi:nucleotide exchange factor GrpE [Mycoplasma struthionis]|uniref:Protein GrpE n=2 Tax=Mycoplasma struthionis TaxID=538220 RepID=A0A3G8LH62_9MOLU|nr:nucleotide exchange factor GrpE [Mycoplasma struthionis]